MGIIQTEVRQLHLTLYPLEEAFLRPFLPHFSVTWARRRIAYNAELSVYFLKPDNATREAFGFQREVLLVYSPYATIEARALQAAESFLFDEPGAGRVDQLVIFLVSDAPNVREWVDDYLLAHRESRMVVALQASRLRELGDDRWSVWNLLAQQLFNRDLFESRLPLERDTYFFGRDEIIRSYRDSIRLSENRGIFGLRKTGKTSLLFKLERMVEADGGALFLYYDCKSPSLRMLRWHELLAKICREISAKCKSEIVGALTERTVAETFAHLVTQATKKRRIILVFDEIEYISPVAVADPHWQADFIPFWQTFWSAQSRCRKISTIVAGVNARVVEVDTFGGIQNPLFGIISYQYLRGFSFDELRLMLDSLGSRMGLRFTLSAAKYLHGRYGGHPLLTRIACSHINAALRAAGTERPADISEATLLDGEPERDAELMFYCRHVVSELAQFYPDEYRMLEWLSSGQIDLYLEFATFSEYTKHLQDYGLVAHPRGALPAVSIPVVGRYVALELARREGRRTIYRVVPTPERQRWLQRRLAAILSDVQVLERHLRVTKSPALYGGGGVPEIHRLNALAPCDGEASFGEFINACYRSFVEAVEIYGKSQSVADYYWKTVKASYPAFWDALQRIRVYRHERMHLNVTETVDEQVRAYLNKDLEGRSPAHVQDVWFVLQQSVLDGLFAGIQSELARVA